MLPMNRLQAFREAREFDQRSTRLIVWLVLLSMIPAFVGFVLAVVEESLLLGVAVNVVTVAVDTAIMLVIRAKLPRREP